jgi:arylsulfatase A
MRPALFSIIVLISLIACQQRDKKDAFPNIIYFIADDLGYGDLSCLGQEKFSTPNLDRLASEGMLFTQHYSGSTVCAPSRSSLMTGQHTGHTPIRGNKSVEPEGQWPIEDETHTLAELLKQKGYVTGGFGKWGLGGPGTEGDPIFQGFDVFFGYNCQGKAHNYYPRHLWDNQEKLVLYENEGTRKGIYAPNLIHEKALEFIETNKDKPFFLYYPNVIPHAELFAPEEYMQRFRGKFLPEKAYQGYDEGPDFRDGPYGSQPESHAAFAAMVTLLDEQVGQEGGADPDYFNSNGIYTGYKRDLYEGGIRVPTIAWWPGKIAANTVTDHLSAFWDVYPTVAELTGPEIHDRVDGISFLPTLLGKEGQQEHEYLYWEFHEKNGRQALRKGDWKLVRYDVFSPEKTTTELYNIAEDPAEKMNVAEENQEITEELLQLMQGARTESTVFTFN